MKDLLLSGRSAVRRILFAVSSAYGRWAQTPRGVSSFAEAESNPLAEEPTLNSEVEYSDPTLVLSISSYLREPLAKTLAVLNANQHYLAQIEQTRNSYTSAKRLKNHIEHFSIPYSEQFRELYSNDPRSRIVASFHFGDFIYGLNKLATLQPSHIHSRVLSQAEYSPTFLENMTRGFGENAPRADDQLLLGEAQVHRLSALLRCSHTTLLMFADLPSSYGGTVRTKFLDRWAWFPKGIAVLALANAVPILPVICYSIGQENRVEIGKQIEAVRLKGESKEAAVSRITQLLIDYFEYFFRQHQEQWRYLAVLPKYFIDPSQECIIE
jgi:predicted LPLAT superfamily acyltransferase